jgi:hypothetical protein
LAVTSQSACSRWVWSASAGDHGVGEVQAVQQRPELGDLVGLAVHFGLGEDAVAGVVHQGEQVDLGTVASAEFAAR